MKKTLLVLAVCIAAFVICGCANLPAEAPAGTPTEAVSAGPYSTEAAVPEIFESSHPREEGYAAAFSTHMLETPGLTVHMENSVFTEAALRGACSRFAETLKAAGDITGAAPGEVTVYIVNRTIEGSAAIAGSRVFCSLEDVESGRADEALLGAAFGLPAEWQRAGLAGLVRGDKADPESLAAFLFDPENAYAASLSPLFMDAELAGEERAEKVKQAAASLAEFAIGEKGFEAFKASKDTARLLPGWLESIGVTDEAVLPEGSEWAADMRVTHEKGCICVMWFDTFTVRALSDGFIKTPDELYSFACGLSRGARLLRERFASEAPSLAALIGERIDAGITAELVDPYYNASYALPDKAEIRLAGARDAVHEMVHVLLRQEAVREETFWIAEALAEHYSLEISGRVFPEYELAGGFDAYLDFFTDVVAECEPNEDDMAFHRAVWNIYERLCSPEAHAGGRDDRDAYSMAYGVSSLLLDGLKRDQIRRKYDRSVGSGYNLADGPKERAGNNLSYPEARVVLEYLAGIYGIEKLTADHVRGLTSAESTGMTWPEIYAAAREYYEKEYGELISDD